MMSNSNYSIGLQRLKPVHTAYCGLHNLAENWYWAREVNGRDRDVCLPRLRRQDQDHNRADRCEQNHYYAASWVVTVQAANT